MISWTSQGMKNLQVKALILILENSSNIDENSNIQASLLKEKTTNVKSVESKIPTLGGKKPPESPLKTDNSKELDLIMQKAQKLRDSMGDSLLASQNFLIKSSVADQALSGIL